MKITSLSQLHANGGWRVLSFLKICTDEGLVGWSEFSESRATPGLGAVIARMGGQLVGQDPRAVGPLTARLRASTRGTAGGIAAQAIAAIENACIDIKAKALGISVAELFGGAMRPRLPLYWSHCGTMRLRHAALFEKAGAAPLRTLDDVVRLGQEVTARGYAALKTNILLFDAAGGRNHQPGFGDGDPGRVVTARMVDQLGETMAAFRQGAGPTTGLMLDLNFNVAPEGIRRIAHALGGVGLDWLEMDVADVGTLADLRRSCAVPFAGLETIHGASALLPYLTGRCADVVIIDVQWQGIMEAMRMAHLAAAHELNVASHNYHGHLSTLMGAHFSAAISNFQIMEFEVDEPAWLSELLTHPLKIENGELILPDRPGWGSDIDEAAVRAHAPRG